MDSVRDGIRGPVVGHRHHHDAVPVVNETGDGGVVSTKPALSARMVGLAPDAGVPASGVTDDDVHRHQDRTRA